MSVELALIVAVAENQVIGNNNELPWRLPADLRYFKQVTMGKPLLMGRKTYESIGRPLPGRANLVLSGDSAFRAEGIEVFHNLDDLLQGARERAAQAGVSEAMVIGGDQVYRALLPLSQRVYLTRVHAKVHGDAHFPALDPDIWRLVSRTLHPRDGANEHSCSFEIHERVDAG